MKHLRLVVLMMLVALILAPLALAKHRVLKPKTFMSVTSTAFQSGDTIPAKYTCDGENIMPPLNISNIPTDAKTLVLLVEDPDTRRGVATHLLAWNIRPTTTRILENKLPNGTIGSNDFGEAKYSGPCPPSDPKTKKPEHRYFYKVLALDGDVNLPQMSKRHDLDKFLKDKIIGESTLVGTYSRVKTAPIEPKEGKKKS